MPATIGQGSSASIPFDDRDRLEKSRSALEREYTTFEAHYRELTDFYKPRRGRYFITDRNKGDKRYNKIVNSTATQALRTATAGMLSGTMSPSRPWFRLGVEGDPALAEFRPVKEWLQFVEAIMRTVFNASNLYNMAPTMLGELLQFGTANMLHVDDFNDVARFYTNTVGSYRLSQSNRRVINTMVREFEMTTEQLVAQFGEANVSTQVKNAWDHSDYYEWWPVVHFIEPNRQLEPGSPFEDGKPWTSWHYEPGSDKGDGGGQKFLGKGGFLEFPVYAPRWEVTGEDIYGTDCPGMTALGDVKQIQNEERRKAQAIDKMVSPPLQGPSVLRNVPVNQMPGGTTLYSGDPSQQGLRALYEVNLRVDELRQDIAEVAQRINEVFFVDLFLAISRIEGIQPRNELDLLQRNEERLLQLGPVLEQLHGEVLDNMIDRTFNQLSRANALPPAPDILQGRQLNITYISTLAQAQRAVATGGIERLAGFTGQLAQMKPDVLDKFDADQAVDDYANAIGVPAGLVVPDGDVEKLRALRLQQISQQQTMEAADTMSRAAQQASQANTGQKNLLTDTSEMIATGARGAAAS